MAIRIFISASPSFIGVLIAQAQYASRNNESEYKGNGDDGKIKSLYEIVN